MIALLKANPLLLLFIVAAIGYGVGNIRIGKSKLGVAAVLFVGLGVGALDKSLVIPDIVFLLGLAIFVYTVGISNGPGFFEAFGKRGKANIYFMTLIQLFPFGIAIALFYLFPVEASSLSGAYAGAVTNTPALASLLDSISFLMQGNEEQALLEEAVVGYSISYPAGVLGCIVLLILFKRWFKVNFEEEANALAKDFPIKSDISNRTIEITNEAICDTSLRDLLLQYKWTLVFGRRKRGTNIDLLHWDSRFQLGDKITLAGSLEEIERVQELLGKEADEELRYDRTSYDTMRVFVSNPEVAGQSIASLNLVENYQAVISRVRRGDIDLLARGDTVLELGDRIRFVSRHKDIPKLVKLFGDSYQKLSQIDLLSFGLGMALGLLLGMVSFTLPGGISFKLGFAGGPLIVALILGALRRTGNIVWALPYSANLTLRQIGLIMLLATVGVRSGHTFVSTLITLNGAFIFLLGAIITLLAGAATLWIGYKWFKIPYSLLSGMISNHPAVVDFAEEQSGNSLPSFGYALSFPIAMILKIIFVQLLFNLLG